MARTTDQEIWVSLPQAVAIVKAAAGLSQGPAQRTLIAICESGDVRARWTGHHLKARPPIHRRDWIGADIDWANFRVVKADGAGMADVDFSEDDLNGWAAKNTTAKSNGITKRQPAKRTAAEDAVKACYPQGVPDVADVSDGALCTQLSGWLQIHRPAMAKMSDRTILRAAGRAS